MKRKNSLICIVLSFALGVGGTSYLQSETQSVPATSHNLPTHPVEFDLPKLNQNQLDYVFQIKTTSRSYYARNELGSLIPEQRNDKSYYQVGENIYNFSRPIHTNKTVLIVMDPWEDSGSSFLNDYYKPVLKKIVPLIDKSINLGIPVVVLTNSPLESVDYSNKVDPKIESLAKQGKLQIIDHQ